MTTALQAPATVDPLMQQLANRVDSEYHEMPGLSLTAAQARRLWRLDPATCEKVLDALVQEGHLRRTRDGSYVRG
jgi:hypothetical protein